jgi:polyisoprenyl-teichoic acid--peptidoglycan teichoic acid transferase
MASVDEPTALPGHSALPGQTAAAGRARGRRIRRPARRRAPKLRGAILITALSALLPGSGYVYTGRRGLGAAVIIASVAAAVTAAVAFPRDLHSAVDFAVDPTRLKTFAVAIIVGLLAWTAVVVTTFAMVRPVGVERWKTIGGGVFVGALCLAVAAPVTIAAKYAMVEADLVQHVFPDDVNSQTTPKYATADDPWGGRNRVNVLLLGGDGGVDRIGVRTDTIILASIDTVSGKVVTFSLPRNMMYARFPKNSPLRTAYPDGFSGEGDPGNWMLNAVYREVPLLNPHILGKSDNEGADALKLAVQGSLGLRVDYYVLINLNGFEQLVDAMGGVTVNINEPIAIGGRTDLGVPPTGWLDPGPNQHLDGWHALWYTRGRYGADDYQRMDRQRCMINAIVDEADPLNLLRRYQALARASKDIVRTDIPRDLLPAFVDLALKMKDTRVKSVVFRSSDDFYPGDPDFDWLHQTVEKALAPHHGERHHKDTVEEDSKSACAYNPVS